MTLKITIKHNGKLNKAGKLTVTDEQGGKVLSNIPVALPLSIVPHSYNQRAECVSFELDKNLLEYQSVLNKETSSYENAFYNLTKNSSENCFVYDNEIIIACNKELVSDARSFIMLDKDFAELCKVVKSKELRVEIKLKSFMFFCKDVNTNKKLDINGLLEEFKKTSKILIKSINENKNKELEINLKKSQKKEEKINKNVQVNIKPIIKNKAIKKSSTNSRSINTYDDPLNDLLAFYNPALALIFHPNSTLAWFLYFNDLGNNVNEINQNFIDKNIHNIQGFENVNSCLFEKTNNGYSVVFFGDNNKSNEIGTLNVNSLSQCYELSTPSGEKNIFVPSEDGKMNLSFISESGNSTTVELVHNGDNFVGNWSTDQAGATIGAALVLDDQLNFSSDLGKKNDLSGYLNNSVENQVFSDSADDFSLQSDQTSVSLPDMDKNVDLEVITDTSAASNYESSPLSSPASDTSSWVSADPYSN